MVQSVVEDSLDPPPAQLPWKYNVKHIDSLLPHPCKPAFREHVYQD